MTEPLKHDLGPEVLDMIPPLSWCRRCLQMIALDEDEDSKELCAGNPHDQIKRLSALVQGMALLWQQIEWAGDNDGFTCCVFCGALNGSTLAHHSDCEWVKMQAEFTRVKTEGAP